MSKKKIIKTKPDKRKIPIFFRAVEKGETKPSVYFGKLIADGPVNFVSYSCHTGDQSIFKERVLEKNEFYFSKIDRQELEVNARKCVYRMKKEAFENKLDYEAAEHNATFAEAKLNEILGEF